MLSSSPRPAFYQPDDNVEHRWRGWLFGSRARGEARPDSDCDVAVFLRDPDSFWKESGRLAERETDILYDTGAVINALPFSAAAYNGHSALMHELRRDGLDF